MIGGTIANRKAVVGSVGLFSCPAFPLLCGHDAHDVRIATGARCETRRICAGSLSSDIPGYSTRHDQALLHGYFHVPEALEQDTSLSRLRAAWSRACPWDEAPMEMPAKCSTVPWTHSRANRGRNGVGFELIIYRLCHSKVEKTKSGSDQTFVENFEECVWSQFRLEAVW